MAETDSPVAEVFSAPARPESLAWRSPEHDDNPAIQEAEAAWAAFLDMPISFKDLEA